jgi:hypothetical protein
VHKMATLWNLGRKHTTLSYYTKGAEMEAETFMSVDLPVVPFSFYFSQLYQAGHHFSVPPTLLRFKDRAGLSYSLTGQGRRNKIKVRRGQYSATVRQFGSLAKMLIKMAAEKPAELGRI